MSTIAAGTTSGTALVSTGNTDGTLQLQINGTTPSVTLATTGAIGVGSTPGYGTNGQFLQSTGSGTAPTWATVSSGMTFLSSVTASASATVDIETTFNSTYDNYLIVATGVVLSTSTNPVLWARMKIGGTYATANYFYHTSLPISNSTAYAAVAANAAAQIVISSATYAGADSLVSFTMNIPNPTSTVFQKAMYWQGTNLNDLGYSVAMRGQGINQGASALTGIRFLASSGNIASGTFRLYGLANS